jgi:hypothetical protein
MFGVAALVASASLVVCSSAVAVSFGPPLGTAPFNVVPTYPYDCSVVVAPFVGVLPLAGPNGRTATSCIWIHVPTPAEVQAAGGRNISLEPL